MCVVDLMLPLHFWPDSSFKSAFGGCVVHVAFIIVSKKIPSCVGYVQMHIQLQYIHWQPPLDTLPSSPERTGTPAKSRPESLNHFSDLTFIFPSACFVWLKCFSFCTSMNREFRVVDTAAVGKMVDYRKDSSPCSFCGSPQRSFPLESPKSQSLFTFSGFN